MADVQIAKTQMTNAGTVGEKISTLAQAILREEAVLASRFRDVSQFAVKGVDKITFPGLGSFVVANRAHGATNERQAPAVFKDSLNLDQNAYLKWGIDSASEVQSTLNWKVECARIAALDHVDYFEEKLLSTVKSFARTVTVELTSLEENKYKELQGFVAVRKAYVKTKAKLANALWIIDEDFEAKILANPGLYQVAGLGQALIVEGKVTSLLGIPVQVRLNAGDAYLVDCTAVNYGFQLAPKYAEQPDINFGTDGVLCAMDQLFGTSASRILPVGHAEAGKSEVIFKLGAITEFEAP